MELPQDPPGNKREEYTAPLPAENGPAETYPVPPKYQKEETPPHVWLKSLSSLALYLFIGYYIFPSYKTLLLITAIVLIHELGHFAAMKWFRYADLGIFFIPLLGAYVSGTKREVSQKESAIILLAGPLPGILIGILFYFLGTQSPYTGGLLGLSYEYISFWFIFLNLFNLLPVYPLDGGQLLNRVYLDEEGLLGKLFVVLSAGALVWFAWNLYQKTGHPVYFIFLLFPLSMILRLTGDSRLRVIEKKVEEAGIDMDKSYDDLPDEDYWKVRNILIIHYPPFRDLATAPPYVYSEKEEKIMSTVQSLLHRHLLQDMNWLAKAFVLLIWILAIASPWLLQMNMSFFSRLGL